MSSGNVSYGGVVLDTSNEMSEMQDISAQQAVGRAVWTSLPGGTKFRHECSRTEKKVYASNNLTIMTDEAGLSTSAVYDCGKSVAAFTGIRRWYCNGS